MARISDEELINELQQLANELEKTPTREEMNDVGKFSRGPYDRAFGSWNAALEAAGLTLNHRADIPEEELIDELQRLADEFGRPPVYEELEDYCEFSGRTYENRFGSWSEALEAAGFEATILPVNEQADDGQRIIPDDVLLNELRELHTEIGRVPRQRDMIEFGRFGFSIYHSRFGSWNAALEAAGLEPNKVHQISEDDLIADLHRLADEFGRTPREQDVLEYGKYSFYTYQDRFDTWNDALRAAGFEPTKLEGEGSVQSLYLAIRRALPGDPWNAVRKEVYEAGSEDCAIESCDSDSESSLHAHHIVPVLAGGTNDPEMSIALCGTCHRSVEAYTATICNRVIAKIAREEGEWELPEAEREAKAKAGDQVSLTLFAEDDQSTSSR